MEITKFSEPLNKGALNQPRFGRKKRRTGQGEGVGGGTLERRALTNLQTAPALSWPLKTVPK